MSEDEREAAIQFIAANPEAGLSLGGGLRKLCVPLAASPVLRPQMLEQARQIIPGVISAREAEWRGFWERTGRAALKGPDKAFTGWLSRKGPAGEGLQRHVNIAIHPLKKGGMPDVCIKGVFMLDVTQTPLPGVVLLTPRRFGDNRGYFSETWNRARMAEHGLDYDFVQDNQSLSATAGTLRGLHFQAPPHAQTKLVRCTRGALFDVAVDIRAGSPTYGKWTGHELSADNGAQLLIPAGFLHGFVTRTPDTEICYKCTDYYAPETEGAVRFDDPDLAIDWQLGAQTPVLSEKDAAAGGLRDFETPFIFKG